MDIYQCDTCHRYMGNVPLSQTIRMDGDEAVTTYTCEECAPPIDISEFN